MRFVVCNCFECLVFVGMVSSNQLKIWFQGQSTILVNTRIPWMVKLKKNVENAWELSIYKKDAEDETEYWVGAAENDFPSHSMSFSVAKMENPVKVYSNLFHRKCCAEYYSNPGVVSISSNKNNFATKIIIAQEFVDKK